MKIKESLFISSLLIVLACNGQNKEKSKINNMEKREKIDISLLEKRAKKIPTSSNTFTYDYKNVEENGNIINISGSKDEDGFVEKIIFSKPSFKTIYKEFYANGEIKKKETFIGERTKIDTSEYYDQDGNVEKVEENKKFGKVKPEDVLKFLESKKIINISNGSGRYDKDGRPTFEIQFDENKQEYIVTIIEGKPNTGPWDDIGEPPAFLPLIYKMDGTTGKVEELK